jgi:membrane protein DedA with SNARE-associated domain
MTLGFFKSLSEIGAYLVVFVAAALEGEVIFVSACILVGQGKLSAAGVVLAAALGGSLGDQLYFFALRGRLSSWLGRFRRVAERRKGVVAHVNRYSTRMILASRFLPGLRIAIPAACAYAEVSPFKFMLLSLLSGFAWATSLTILVSYLGPQALAWLGFGTWFNALIPVLLVLGFAYWIRRSLSRSLWECSKLEPPTEVGSESITTSGPLIEGRRQP